MTSDTSLYNSLLGRRCLRCGAELGLGNEVHCSSACAELERRGVIHGLEPHAHPPVVSPPEELILKYEPRVSEDAE